MFKKMFKKNVKKKCSKKCSKRKKSSKVFIRRPSNYFTFSIKSLHFWGFCWDARLFSKFYSVSSHSSKQCRRGRVDMSFATRRRSLIFSHCWPSLHPLWRGRAGQRDFYLGCTNCTGARHLRAPNIFVFCPHYCLYQKRATTDTTKTQILRRRQMLAMFSFLMCKAKKILTYLKTNEPKQ